MKLLKDEKEFIKIEVVKKVEPQIQTIYKTNKERLAEILTDSLVAARCKNAIKALLADGEEFDESKLKLEWGCYGLYIDITYHTNNVDFEVKKYLDAHIPADRFYVESGQYTGLFLTTFIKTKCTDDDKRLEAYQTIIDTVSTEIIDHYNKTWTECIENVKAKVNY